MRFAFFLSLLLSVGQSQRLTDEENELRLQTCGTNMKLRSSSRKILNGIPAKITEAPWTVAVEVMNGVPGLCTGTLISPRHFITARHCFAELSVGHYEWIVGPDANKKVPGCEAAVGERDILQESPSDCVAHEDVGILDSNLLTKLYGFGLDPANGTHSAGPLRQETVRAVQCRYSTAVEDKFCTKSVSGIQLACMGDSGGGVVRKVKGRVTLLGAIYRGAQCEDFPKNATDEIAYVGWYSKEICKYTGVCPK